MGVSGLLMNLTHNAGLAFQAILSVKAFFAGQASNMGTADVYTAGYSVGQIIFYLLVDSSNTFGVPPDPYDTLYNH